MSFDLMRRMPPELLAEYAREKDRIRLLLLDVNEFTIGFTGGRTKKCKYRPLSAKQKEEIHNIFNAYREKEILSIYHEKGPKDRKVTANGKVYKSWVTAKFAMYRLLVKYSLGISKKEFDEAYWDSSNDLLKKGIIGTGLIVDTLLTRSYS